jgi:general nucleoside transport system permease protein
LTLTRRIFFGLAAPVAAVVLSLLISAIVLWASGYDAIGAFKAMWSYIDSTESVVEIINRAIPFYVSALAVAIGFKMNLFNIGVQGQYLMAALLAAGAGAAVTFPALFQVSFIMLVAVVVGAAWASIAAVLKVWRGVSEVISTLMLNFIATSGLIAYLLTNYLRATNEAGDLVTKTKPLPPESFIPPLNRFLEVFGLHLPAELNGFLVGAILLGVGFYVLVWRTRFGFDLRATGANAAAARAAGVNPKAMILKTMAISGGIAGLVAIGPMLGDPQFHRYNEQLGGTLFGFTGIAVALLGRNHPAGIAFAALLFATIDRATQVLSLRGIPQEISKIMQGTIILSAVIAYEVVRRIRVAAEVRDAAAKAEPRAMGGAIPERVPA